MCSVFERVETAVPQAFLLLASTRSLYLGRRHAARKRESGIWVCLGPLLNSVSLCPHLEVIFFSSSSSFEDLDGQAPAENITAFSHCAS